MTTLTITVDADTCDACPHAAHVAAYLYVELPTGTLAYCAHHGTQYLPKLTELGAHIIDLRHTIGK